MAFEFGVRVGVLGGGQLGRMMALDGARINIEVIPLDPLGRDSPAGLVSRESVHGSFRDQARIISFFFS